VERFVDRRWPCGKGKLLLHDNGFSLNVWDAALIAAKTLTYAGTFGSAGAVFFLAHSGAWVTSADRRSIQRLVIGLAVLSALAGGAQLLVTAGSMTGAAAGMMDGSLLHMVWQAGAGRAATIRMIGLLLAALVMLPDRFLRLACVGAVMAATSFAWTGHAQSLHPDVLPILLLGVHLLGVAFWLGALMPLAIVARNSEISRIAAIAARFGASAVFVVGGLLAAGLGLLWMMLGGVTQLWASAYGRDVVVKLAFVAGLLSFAAFNKLRLTPRLLTGDIHAARSLRTSIRLELFLGASILAVTAALTTIAGPPALD
jgi:putative copper resistance protein D